MSTYRERFISREPNLSKQDKLFLTWVDEVENIVKEQTGFGLLDISDMPYYVSFEDNMSPRMMAKHTINNIYSMN